MRQLRLDLAPRPGNGIVMIVVERKQPSLAAALALALAGLVMLACLARVLAEAAGPLDSWRWGIGLLVPSLIGLAAMLRLAERARIRKAVEAGGGRVLRLRRLPFWRQGWTLSLQRSRADYAIEYVGPMGAIRRGLCRTSMIHGVELPSHES